MIPSITPPTDNLYKFISLFGLTILLFSVYNFGITYDASAKNRMGIEDVKVSLQEALYQKFEKVNDSLDTASVRKHFRPGQIRQMDEDLVAIGRLIEKSGLNPVEEIKLSGQICKLGVALDTLYQKQCGYIAFSCIGFLLMIFGFFRWHHKEQKIRDQMLAIEHAIKVLDKMYYREDQTKRNVESEVAQSLFKQEGPKKN